ncbi:hypothetical protein HZA40_00810 [Candidatus Peregrinibacteria bacterium]|nr:hypothetical protein [Candidatus Peregrinibacteria bacterium]
MDKNTIEEEEPENIKNEDWRLQAITTLAKEFRGPSGHVSPIGSPVIQMGQVHFDGNVLGFGLPNTTALYLNLSHKFFLESQVYVQSDFYKKNNPKEPMIYAKSDLEIFDYLEKRIASIVFAFTALESFVNQRVPDDFVYEVERKDKKCVEKYNKIQIEKFLNLDVKLGEVLPLVMKILSPRGKTAWNGYTKLKKIRDRLIHIKTRDTNSHGVDDDSVWHELLDKKSPNFAKQAKEIIEYFHPSGGFRPRWLKKIPF